MSTTTHPLVLSRSHALRGNAVRDALRRFLGAKRREEGRRASRLRFPRRAWEPGFGRNALVTVLTLAAALAGCGGETGGTGGEDAAPAAVVLSPSDGDELLNVYDGIGGDFALTDHRGERFRLADTHGRIRLLFFGYATCPDVCPLTLSRIAQLRRLLGDDSGEILTLFVSVDPERDTPARLSDYLGYFGLGEALALTGTREEVDAVVDLFKATYEKQDDAAAGYLIHHTSYVFLIDRQGAVRALIKQSDELEKAAAAIRTLL